MLSTICIFWSSIKKSESVSKLFAVPSETNLVNAVRIGEGVKLAEEAVQQVADLRHAGVSEADTQDPGQRTPYDLMQGDDIHFRSVNRTGVMWRVILALPVKPAK